MIDLRLSRTCSMASVLLLVASLSACTDPAGGTDGGMPDGAEAGFVLVPIDALDAEVEHPTTGRLLEPRGDLAWEVDLGVSYGLEELRTAIEGAPAMRDEANPLEDSMLESVEDYALPVVSEFHFWPNIIDLSAVQAADSALFEQIIDPLLQRDPMRDTLRAELDDDLRDGERVVLARDFLSYVVVDGYIYYEVHYALLLNLDAHSISELQVHREAARGLGRLHDPAIDDLRAAFMLDGGDAGVVWHLCLRGNRIPSRYQAIVVDRAPEDFDWDHVYLRCGDEGLPPPPPDDRDPPPYEPPPEPPPPGGGVIITGGGAGGGDEGAGEDPEGEVVGTEEERRGEPGMPDGCGPGLMASDAALTEARAAYEALRMDHNRDVETFNMGTRSGPLTEGLEFRSPCIRTLYDRYLEMSREVQMRLDDATTAAEAATGAVLEADEGLTSKLSVSRHRNSLWSNMLYVGGVWRNVSIVPWLLMGDSAFVDERTFTPFHRDIARGLMQGLTWEEAVDNAHTNLLKQLSTSAGSGAVRAIFIQITGCWKELYRKQLRLFLPTRYPDASESEIESMTEVMLNGAEALTAEERAAYDEYREDREDRVAEQTAAWDRVRMLREELENLRRRFRTETRPCFEEGRRAIALARQRVWLLEGFAEYCAAGSDPSRMWTYYWQDPEVLCEALRALRLEAIATDNPRLLQFAQLLLRQHCGDSPTICSEITADAAECDDCCIMRFSDDFTAVDACIMACFTGS